MASDGEGEVGNAMKFCTRCGSRTTDREICHVCGAIAYRAAPHSPVAEYPRAGDLPTFTFRYSIEFLGLIERERNVSVPFSYLNGTLSEVRRYEDPTHSVHTQLWLQHDDPLSAPRDPIVGRESQPSIKNIVRLKLGSGVERSFVLTQVRLRAKAGSHITLIFPIPMERAMNPVYDYAAIAAVDYATNDYTWSTTHPEIHAIRTRLPEDQSEPFAGSLARYLDGLCRRCMRLFGQHRRPQRRYRFAAGHAELMQ
jgi:rRNA maturation protein Nop10